MKTTLLTVAAVVALAATAATAVAADLVGDRPDFTESALTVAPESLQLEAGGTFTTADFVDTWEVGEALLRYGLKPGTELRFALPTYVDLDVENSAVGKSGVSNAAVGIKQELLQGTRARPQLAVLTSVALPIGDEDIGASDTAVDLVLAAQWALNRVVGLGMNVGGEVVFADDTAFRQWFSGSVAFALTDRLGAFAESFVFTEELEDFAPYVDAGVTYLLTDDLQVDARVGQGLGDVDDETFFGAGLVTRF